MGKKHFALAILLWLAAVMALSLLSGPAPFSREVVWDLRLPRLMAGLVVGFALGISGVLFQALLRNPLADPYWLGTSSGASFGIVLAGLTIGASRMGLYGFAVVAAFVTIALVYRLAEVDGQAPVQTLLLAGVVVSTFLNAVVFLFMVILYKESFSTLFFLLGTLSQIDPKLLWISTVLIACGGLYAVYYAPLLDVLSQGEETAFHLGVNVESVKKRFFWAASLLVASAVILAGMIGFIGLIVPHLVRLAVGPDHRRLLPWSGIVSGVLLVTLDYVARTAAAPLEIPVGILAAFLGTPFFIWMLRRKRGDVF